VRGSAMGFLNIGKLRSAYKERVTPASRKKFGHLERHKDYVERAKDFHHKEDTLKKLRLAAATKNPDEFNRDMLKAQLKNGVHFNANTQGKKTTKVKVRENTEDLTHLMYARTHQAKVVEKLRDSLSLTVAKEQGNDLKPKITVFTESPEERLQVLSEKLILDEKLPASMRLKKQMLTKQEILNEEDLSAIDAINSKRQQTLQRLHSEEAKLSELDSELAKIDLERKKITVSFCFVICDWILTRVCRIRESESKSRHLLINLDGKIQTNLHCTNGLRTERNKKVESFQSSSSATRIVSCKM
jgi:U3 small nucleolar RNA-associated protein 11